MIRPAVEADVPELVAMIRELAAFEDLADQVQITEDDLGAALFGPESVVHDSVVEDGDGGLAGHALWFRTFSTFLGKTGIWLEDLYVREAHRRQGHAAGPARPPARADRQAGSNGRCWSGTRRPSTSISSSGARPMAGWTHYRWYDG